MGWGAGEWVVLTGLGFRLPRAGLAQEVRRSLGRAAGGEAGGRVRRRALVRGLARARALMAEPGRVPGPFG